jgi:hypothetical protein
MNPNIDPIEFGAGLINTLDLDPVYVALEYGIPDYGQRARACVAYFLYYHLGVAAKISETPGPEFWTAVKSALPSASAPRGTERRHYRGVKAVNSASELQVRFPAGAEALIAHLRAPETPPPALSKPPGALPAPGVGLTPTLAPPGPAMGLKTASPGVRNRTVQEPRMSYPADLAFATVRERVLDLPQFGPWIAFKVADMLERVLKIPIDFSDCQLLEFYDEPREGAEAAARLWKLATPELALEKMAKHFRVLSPMYAPPTGNRMVNIQEIETILCKWKAYVNGRYEIGKDTYEVAHGLLNYPSGTGDACLRALESRSPILKKRKARALVHL